MAKARGRRIGSVEELADGRIKARLTVGYNASGNPVRETRLWPKGTPRRTGELWLADRATAHGRGEVANDEHLTVAAFLTRWLESMDRKLEPKSRDSYAGIVKKQIVPYLGDLRLSKLEPLDLERWLGRLDREGYSARTAQYARSLLGQALKQAVRWRMIVANPVASVDPPKLRPSTRRAHEPEHARAFLEAARGSRLFGLYLLALTTGMRRGELLGLRWQDVDLERALVSVVNTIPFVRGKPSPKRPKTPAGERTVAVGPDAVLALRERRATYELERAAAGARWREHHLVFGSTLGTPLYDSTLRRDKKRVALAAGVPDLTMHELGRHTYISLAARARVPVKVVSERVGHKSTRMTQDVYEKTYRDSHRAAALPADELFASPEAPSATVLPPANSNERDALN